MKLGRLLKAASVAFVPLVAGVLFLMVPASAQNNGQDPDIRMSIDIGDIREGRRATLTFSFVDGDSDMVDRHVYVAISGTATEGSQADFTITGSNGSSLPSIGDTLYDREIVIPAGATSAYARINVRNDNDAEQCEVIKVEGLWRDTGGSAKAFLGILELRIPANDLSRPHSEVAPIGVGTVVVSRRRREVDRHSERSRRRNQGAMDVGSFHPPGWPLGDRRTLHGQLYTQGGRCRALSAGRSPLRESRLRAGVCPYRLGGPRTRQPRKRVELAA